MKTWPLKFLVEFCQRAARETRKCPQHGAAHVSQTLQKTGYNFLMGAPSASYREQAVRTAHKAKWVN